MGRLILGFLFKDAKVFAVDRQAVVMSFIIPILVASILGWLDTSATKPQPNQKIAMSVTDLDHSDISKALVASLQKDDNVTAVALSLADAQRQAKEGGPVAAIIPSGFGKEATDAMSNGGQKPAITLLTDPANPTNGQVAKGALLSDASKVVAQEVYAGLAGNASAPLEVKEETAAAQKADWGGAAHEYAGFGLMGLLFFAIEAAVSLVRDKKLGIWRRLRAAPVNPAVFVLTRGISSTILAFAIILFMFAFGALLFGIRILGSVPGFFLVAFSTAVMSACLGLLVSNLSRSENQARGVSMLVVFTMLATGGAWFPISRMPDWIQKGANYLPVRWSVEGFDAMTWRGLGLSDGLRYSGALLGFAAIFMALAMVGFRYVRAE
ncbi:MAG TPA: ABC transporter permease [Fimbriimonadaceae bacterium]